LWRPEGKKFEGIFTRFDTIHKRDGHLRDGGQTPQNGTGRRMQVSRGKNKGKNKADEHASFYIFQFVRCCSAFINLFQLVTALCYFYMRM